MATADKTILPKITQLVNSIKGQFKQTANDNNRNISSVSRDLGRHFSAQQNQIRTVTTNVDEIETRVQQNASKVDNLTNLVNSSLAMQNDILKTLKSLLKNTDDIKANVGAGSPLAAAIAGVAGVGAGAAALGALGGNSGSQSPVPFNGENRPILETIKARESGGDYKAENNTSTASGAYQFIDKTWRSRAEAAGVDTKMYPRAKDAPPEIQDRVADKYVSEILKQANNDVSKVPVAWYSGNINGKSNDVSQEKIAKYQSEWMKDFAKHGGQQNANKQATPNAEGAPSGTGAQLTPPNSSSPNTQNGGNGNLNPSSLQSVGGEHKLQPAAAQAYISMVDAAKAEGITWNITDSYRTYDQQVKLAKEKGLYSEGGLAAEPGKSNHGWGTALDLGGGAQTPNSDQNKWLQQNAGRFGFATIPREPWHWEYKGGGVDTAGRQGGQQQAGVGNMGMGGMGRGIPMNPYAMLGGMLGGGRGAAIGAIAGAVLPSALGVIGNIFGGGGASPGISTGGTPQARLNTESPMLPSLGSGSPFGFARSGSDEDTAANFFAADKRMQEKNNYLKQTAEQPLQQPTVQAKAKEETPNQNGPTINNHYHQKETQEQGSWVDRLANMFPGLGKNVQYPFNPVG